MKETGENKVFKETILRILRTIMKFFLVSFIIFVIIILIFIYWFACKSENRVIKSVASPDGRYIAIYFQHAVGGAAGSVSEGISVIKKDKRLKNIDSRNIFVIDRAKFIDIIWEDNCTLVVRYSTYKGYKPLLQKNKLYDINIIYENVSE